MMSPTRGAAASQRPKMADVLTERRKVGLSPPSTSEVLKLSRLRVRPSVSSAIIRFPRTLAAEAGDLALQVGSHPLLASGTSPPTLTPGRTARQPPRLATARQCGPISCNAPLLRRADSAVRPGPIDTHQALSDLPRHTGASAVYAPGPRRSRPAAVPPGGRSDRRSALGTRSLLPGAAVSVSGAACALRAPSEDAPVPARVRLEHEVLHHDSPVRVDRTGERADLATRDRLDRGDELAGCRDLKEHPRFAHSLLLAHVDHRLLGRQ